MSSLSENNPKGEEMAPKNDGNNNNNNNPKLGASPRRLPSTTSSPVLVVKQSEIDYAITPRPLRILILVSTLLENLIFSGIIFGWPALFYMLKNENIYSELCEPVTDNSLVPANIFNVTTNAVSYDLRQGGGRDILFNDFVVHQLTWPRTVLQLVFGQFCVLSLDLSFEKKLTLIFEKLLSLADHKDDARKSLTFTKH